MTNNHNKKHNTISQRYSRGYKASRSQAPQPKGYDTPKEWMQFLGVFARTVDVALTASSEVDNNNADKPIGNTSGAKNNREQLTGDIDINRYNSLENSINTLRDNNIKEHNSLRQEWCQDIRNTKQDIERQVLRNREEAINGIEASNKRINIFLSILATIVTFVVGVLGLIFKCSDDNIQKIVDDNKTEIRENRRIIEESRERIIRLEEKNKKQEELSDKLQRKKN